MKAAKAMPGCHLPCLYVGIEYCCSDNALLAEKFVLEANRLAPEDPFTWNEMGVLALKAEKLEKSVEFFTKALRFLSEVHPTSLPPSWAPLLENLGHCYRRTKRYDEALNFYQQALLISPRNAGIFGAIGLTSCRNSKISTNAKNFGSLFLNIQLFEAFFFKVFFRGSNRGPELSRIFNI